MDKLVSILIPNYNGAKYLEETLDSIRAQTHSDFECIIVDDHSTDESWNILLRYAQADSRFKVFRRPEQLVKGSNSCRNYAFSIAKGNYVNWFDSDDVMHPEFIARKLSFLLDNPNADAVVSKLASLDHFISNEQIDRWLPAFTDLKTEYLVNDIQFSTPGPLFRRASLNGIRLFRPGVRVGQEKEFFYRLILRGLKFKVIDERLTFYRTHPNSIIGSFKGRHFTYDAQQHVFLMLKALIETRDFPASMNTFIKTKLALLLKVIKLERKWKQLPGWAYIVLLFFVYKKSDSARSVA